MGYKYLDNAFWEADDRSVMKCIRLTDQPDGKQKKEVLQLARIRSDGSECPMYKEVVQTWGIQKIDENTNERKKRKETEAREARAKHEQKKKSVELEQLFNLKLQAFEIEEVKNSDDRAMRSKIRRAKNVIEMQALTSILIAKELGYFGEKNE